MHAVAVTAVTLAVAVTWLVRFEHRRSRVAELWIVTLPGGYEASVQRTEGTDSWAAFWFDDRGGNTLLFFKKGNRPQPLRAPTNDGRSAVA